MQRHVAVLLRKSAQSLDVITVFLAAHTEVHMHWVVHVGRHGTTESKLRSLNPALQQSEAYLTSEGETLSSVASEQQLSLTLLRQFNPELSSWPSEEPLPAGTTLLLPVYRSTTPIPAGTQLLVPGYLPSTQLPAGEWIYLPARRSAPAAEEGMQSLG
jgi:hypothetical protein